MIVRRLGWMCGFLLLVSGGIALLTSSTAGSVSGSLDPDDAVAIRDRVTTNTQRIIDLDNRVEKLETWEHSHIQRHEDSEAAVAKQLAIIHTELSAHATTQARNRQEWITIGIAVVTLLVSIFLTRLSLRNHSTVHELRTAMNEQLAEAKEDIRQIAFAAGVMDERARGPKGE